MGKQVKLGLRLWGGPLLSSSTPAGGWKNPAFPLSQERLPANSVLGQGLCSETRPIPSPLPGPSPSLVGCLGALLFPG